MGLRDRGRTGHMRIILIRNYPFIFIIKPPVYPSFFYLDVNECLINSICKNGGTCINTHGGYRCQCLSGYQGKHCEQGTKNPLRVSSSDECYAGCVSNHINKYYNLYG